MGRTEGEIDRLDRFRGEQGQAFLGHLEDGLAFEVSN